MRKNTADTWPRCHREHRKALLANDTKKQRKTWVELRAATTEALKEYNHRKDLEVIQSDLWSDKFRRICRAWRAAQ